MALTSSAQIVIARSADFPVPASGPVSAMLKPIFNGSSAAAGKLEGRHAKRGQQPQRGGAKPLRLDARCHLSTLPGSGF